MLVTSLILIKARHHDDGRRAPKSSSVYKMLRLKCQMTQHRQSINVLSRAHWLWISDIKTPNDNAILMLSHLPGFEKGEIVITRVVTSQSVHCNKLFHLLYDHVDGEESFLENLCMQMRQAFELRVETHTWTVTLIVTATQGVPQIAPLFEMAITSTKMALLEIKSKFWNVHEILFLTSSEILSIWTIAGWEIGVQNTFLFLTSNSNKKDW